MGEAYTMGGRIADAMPLLTQAMEEARALAERALALARQHEERGNQVYALRQWETGEPLYGGIA